MKNRKFTRITFIVLAIIILIAGAAFFVNRSQKTNNALVAGSAITSQFSNNTVQINKSFEFKAVNVKKDKKAVKFTIAGAERSREIKVQGESKQITKGKNYLLIRLEIENPFTERLAIIPSDLIRLEDEDGKHYAPDYHNGNVVLDPISVRKDLVSFIVPESQSKFILQVGELEGEKQKVEINF